MLGAGRVVLAMLQLLEANPSIRKTTEPPLRVSILDAIGSITGFNHSNSQTTFKRLLDTYPDLATSCAVVRFPGRGQFRTAVADMEALKKFIRLLPGRRAAQFREKLVNYLDAGNAPLDAAGILEERGCSPKQIERLAGELGRDLLLICRAEDQLPLTAESQYGPATQLVGQYNRRSDAKLIEDVYKSFRERPLYKKVMEDGENDQRKRLLNDKGRGRGTTTQRAKRARVSRRSLSGPRCG